MAGKQGSKGAKAETESHGYEFGGPLGAFGISFGLPILCYLFFFLCNELTGCPAPSIRHPSTLTIDALKREVGWPDEGIAGFASWRVTGWVLAYYCLSLFLYRVLPGEHVEGVELRSGGKLKYKFNTWSSSVTTIVALAAGTAAQGADFPVWTFIWDNYLQILTANILIAFFLACFVYARSFSVKPGNPEHRELAAGGNTGNVLYDWFIGRELNPRVVLPFFGEIDIKEFMELRPGLLGWIILDFACVAHQYKKYGFVTDSILLITTFQTLYVFDSYWMESSILTTMDITTDGFGFMLSFGDLVWVPFIYTIQARYLAMYPLQLGIYGTAGVLAILATGYYIFRSANNEKNRFRTNPKDPRVAHLKYMETASGSKLLTSGWWGTARHINYTGDWIMAWSYSLPTGLAGFVVENGTPVADGFKGWGMAVTYFYVIYFAVLLIHREMRDEEKCLRKYGKDWEKYRKLVPYRFIPGIY